MTCVPYGLSVEGSRGEVHSIDKLIIDFVLIDFDVDDVLDSLVQILQSSSDWHYQPDKSLDGFNGYQHKKPSSAYSWFSSAFWCDGLMVRLGGYSRHGLVWWRDSRVRVEFNPNKSFLNDSINKVLYWLVGNSKGKSFLVECDYCVDVPSSTSEISSQSRKHKIIYNDSRYYGKRHQNGRLKVYNKAIELKQKQGISIDYPLTRCEMTFRWGGTLDFSSCVWLSGSSLLYSCLSSNLRSIAQLIELAASYGEDREELLTRFVPDKRNRDKLRPVIVGQYQSFVFNREIFLDLLDRYKVFYPFHYSFMDGDSSDILGADVMLFDNIVSISRREVGTFDDK